jgi:fatty acid desaturase
MNSVGKAQCSSVSKDFESFLQRFRYSEFAPLLTHTSLIAFLLIEFALIRWWPLWLALIPCMVIQHRIEILLHDYIHGSVFRRYKHNLLVLTAMDGLLLHFGALEIFRGTHLAHHRWMNTENDPGFWAEPKTQSRLAAAFPLWRLLRTLRDDVSLYMRFPFEPRQLRYIYVKPYRAISGAVLSVTWILICFAIGLAQVPVALIAIQLSLIVPLSLRAAVEHSSYPGDSDFANEYRVLLPLFNRNRHVHHHLEPAVPWYLLRFRTPNPLPPLSYWRHWYHVFIKRDYVLMQPLRSTQDLREKVDVVVL